MKHKSKTTHCLNFCGQNKTKKQHFIRDPLYKNILLSPLAEALVKTPEFQRLKWISQLGCSRFNFPGAVHTRFSHSLGVYFLITFLFRTNKVVTQEISCCEQELIAVSGLLHDLGHGPFSHAFERLEGIKGKYSFFHTTFTVALIRDNKTIVNKVLRRFKVNVGDVITILTKKPVSSSPLLLKYASLVSGQFDCDRLDYLLRDSYFAGVDYGYVDWQWLLSNLAFNSEEGFYFTERALPAVENFLFARYHMYYQLYFHKKNVFYESLLENIFFELWKFLKTPSGQVFLKTKQLLATKIKVLTAVLSGDYQQVLLSDWNVLTDYYLVSFLTELHQALDFHCSILTTYLHVFLSGEEKFTTIVLPSPTLNRKITGIFCENTFYNTSEPVKIKVGKLFLPLEGEVAGQKLSLLVTAILGKANYLTKTRYCFYLPTTKTWFQARWNPTSQVKLTTKQKK